MEMILVEDCCEILDSKRIPITAKDRIPGPYPYYGANGIQDYVDNYIFDDELVLLAEDGGNFGSTEKPIAYRVSGKCWVNNHAHVLKPKQGIDVDYLCYSLMFYDTSGLVNGATRQKLTQSTLKKMCIPKRTVKQQLQIAQELNIIKKLITARQQELQKLDDLIKARFVEMFGDNDKKIAISSLCDVSGGYSFKSEDISSTGFIKILQIGNVYLDDVNWETTNYLPKGFDNVYSRFLLNEGDIVIALTRPIIQSLGNVKACIVKVSDTPCLLNQRVGRIVSKKNVDVNLKFIYGCLMTDDFTRYVESCCIGCSQPNISTKDIENYMIPDASYEKQMDFVKFKEQVDKSKHHSPHLPNPPLKWYPLPKNEVPIMEEKIIAITNEMAEVLNIAQLKKLQEVLVKAFSTEEPERKPTNHEYLRLFLEAKSIEGCSPRTLQYYEVTVQHLFAAVNLPVRKMTTERMREYLSDYQQRRNCSKATIDNIRRNISSFFSWLEEEDHILKSPMRRIHKIKTKKTVKEVISDEDIEKLRDSCTTLRDLAMIDLLYSTGIRVGELVRLNIEDVNFESRECVVFGKGDKERRVYFDAKTKIHLKNYLESRRDTNRALFVSLLAPYNRLAISGVEIRLRKMGRMLNLKSIHPHKFRRTMATRAIDKGMPIEQVQKILGHSQIDTTMQYAIVNQNNVKMSHQKYIA